jgi:ribose transport system substrate-binding protein
VQQDRHDSNYVVDAVMRACDILECFSNDSEALRLTDIAARTGLHKTTALRLLTTLERRGLVVRSTNRGYHLAIRMPRRQRFRIGYATQSTEFAFSREVTESIERAAKREELELILLDNRYGSRVALRNAEIFIREKVDLVMEFQTYGEIAPVIASKFGQHKIPLIAIEIPHPGAIYYGANNYEAGLIGGRHLGRWSKARWQGEVDEVLFLELRSAGPLPRSRLTGMWAGLRETLPSLSDRMISNLDGNGQFGKTLDLVRKHLRKKSSRHTLVCAVNDPSAIGALRAFEEAGHVEDCAVMGQNASLEARAEMRRKGTRLVGSVAYFPERYGDGLISLALDVLNKRPVGPAVFVKHKLITPENVDHYYPNDELLHPSQLDSVL